MLFFELYLCLIVIMVKAELVTLQTNEILTVYNNSLDERFEYVSGGFDCSEYVYTYSQSQQQFQSNSGTQIKISSISNSHNVSIRTLYNHLQPTLNQSQCNPPSCNIIVQYNCPSVLHKDNYFDILFVQITNITTFSYAINCNIKYFPIYIEWGQAIITVLSTIILIIGFLSSNLVSFGGSGIQYNIMWVVIMGSLIITIGLISLFFPNVASPLLNVISWIIGPLAVGLIVLQILFFFLKHKAVGQKSFMIKKLEIRYIDIVSFVIGLGWTFGWWFSSKNWIISDITSICIVISFIKIFKFVSLKVAVISYLIISSIWVLGVVLAIILRGQKADAYFLEILNNPFQFQIPVLNPVYHVNCSWIAITSIAFPGILAAYLRRFDYSRATNIYIIASSIAYFLGAILWNVVSSFSRRSVPFDTVTQFFMMITIVLMACNRKQLRTIWDGTFWDQQYLHKEQIQKLGLSLSVTNPQKDLVRQSIPDTVYLDSKRQIIFNQIIQRHSSIKGSLITNDKL